MPSSVRRESELTSSFALILQIQWIMAWSLCWRHFSVSTFMAKASGQKRQMAVGEKARGSTLSHTHLQRVIAATYCREHVQNVAELWDNFTLFLSNINLFISLSSIALAVPCHRAHLSSELGRNGPFNATVFLMHQALAANTEDCTATYSCLTDTTGVHPR